MGALVGALELKPAALGTKQARRFFAGEIVSPKQRRKIFRAFARALVTGGLLPQASHEGLPPPSEEILATVIAAHAERWDNLGAYAYSHSGRVYREQHAIVAYLRLVVVDLAVRGIALLWLMGVPEPGEDTPTWAKHLGVAHSLRSLLSEANFTREDFAETLGVSDRTVDVWLDEGVRPDAKYIRRMGAELGQRVSGRSAESVTGLLTRSYWLSSIADLLAQVIDRPTVEMLARALCVLITRILPDLRTVEPSSHDEAAAIQWETLMLGCAAPQAQHLLDIMWREEGNREWRIDIQAAKVNWVQRIQHQIAKTRTPDSDGSSVARLANAAVSEVAANSFEALATGDATIAERARLEVIQVFRAAIQAEATDAWLHFQLGSVLGELGEVDEAIRECWLAAGLEPGWDPPLHEIGVIYFNAGRIEESRQHLEGVVAGQKHPPWNALMNLGVARMRTGDAQGGLEALEKALEAEANHPIILKAASECASSLGQNVKARHYAKRAQLRGASATSKFDYSTRYDVPRHTSEV